MRRQLKSLVDRGQRSLSPHLRPAQEADAGIVSPLPGAPATAADGGPFSTTAISSRSSSSISEQVTRVLMPGSSHTGATSASGSSVSERVVHRWSSPSAAVGWKRWNVVTCW